MIGRAQAPLVTLAVGATVLAAAASGTPARVPDLSPLGTWTLADLGAPSGLTFDGARKRWSPTWQLPFSLRANECAGGSNWWAVHLHYRVTFAASAPIGASAIFGAMTNQVACAYVRFDVARSGGGKAIRTARA